MQEQSVAQGRIFIKVSSLISIFFIKHVPNVTFMYNLAFICTLVLNKYLPSIVTIFYVNSDPFNVNACIMYNIIRTFKYIQLYKLLAMSAYHI